MTNKSVFVFSEIIAILGVLCMGFNRFILTLSDNVVRIVGVIILIDLVVLSYSTVRLKKYRT